MDFTELSLSKTTIYKNKLLNNIHYFKKQLQPDTAFMAVVKANAYGHGASHLALAMEKEKAVDYFGVAQLSEAMELRTAGVRSPILLFNAVRLNEIDLAIENNITLTVFSTELALAIVNRAASIKKHAKVHLKIDSGMGRVGVTHFDTANEIYQILNTNGVIIEGIYTHFADATDTAPGNFTDEQFQCFQQILNQFTAQDIHFDLVHACNTAATINFPNYHLDMVRVGIGLYGFNPNPEPSTQVKLHPIQNVEAKITHLKTVPAGQSIGYNRNFFTKQPMKIATVAIGYADGVPKCLSNKGYFRYHTKKTPIVGDVCMDQTMVDVSPLSELCMGDYLTYFGDPADGYSSAFELAQIIDISVYELLCALGQRTARIYE